MGRAIDVAQKLVDELARESFGVLDETVDTNDAALRRVMFSLRERGKQRMALICALCKRGEDFYELAAGIGRSIHEMALRAWKIRTAGKEKLDRFVEYGELRVYDAFRKIANVCGDDSTAVGIRGLSWFGASEQKWGRRSKDIGNKIRRLDSEWSTRRLAAEMDAAMGDSDGVEKRLDCTIFAATSSAAHGGAQGLVWSAGSGDEGSGKDHYRVMSAWWKTFLSHVIDGIVLKFVLLISETSAALKSEALCKPIQAALKELSAIRGGPGGSGGIPGNSRNSRDINRYSL